MLIACIVIVVLAFLYLLMFSLCAAAGAGERAFERMNHDLDRRQLDNSTIQEFRNSQEHP